jgi:hypothetical protein
MPANGHERVREMMTGKRMGVDRKGVGKLPYQYQNAITGISCICTRVRPGLLRELYRIHRYYVVREDIEMMGPVRARKPASTRGFPASGDIEGMGKWTYLSSQTV